jgi:hypothetical protein
MQPELFASACSLVCPEKVCGEDVGEFVAGSDARVNPPPKIIAIPKTRNKATNIR